MLRKITEDLFLELGELLNSNLDEVTILRTFCNRVLALFDAERVSILSLDPLERNLSLTAWAGRYPQDMEGVTVPIGEGVSGWVAGTGEALLVPDVDKDIRFTDVQLVKKRGGKSDYSDHFSTPITAAVLVISDSTFEGTREDRSGVIIREFLQEKEVDVRNYEVLPDVQDTIRNRLKELADAGDIDLIITTGGTGFGPKDLTPEATAEVIEKRAPGIEEAIRRHGKDRTPYAMLSREMAGLRNHSIIVNLPGSSKGAEESLQALFPGLLHGFPMIWGGGHDKPGAKS